MKTEFISSIAGLSWTVERLTGPAFLELSVASRQDCFSLETERQKSLLLNVPKPDANSSHSFSVLGAALERAAESGSFDCVQAIMRICPELATQAWIQKIQLSLDGNSHTFEQQTTFGAIALITAIQHGHWDIADHLSELTGIELEKASKVLEDVGRILGDDDE